MMHATRGIALAGRKISVQGRCPPRVFVLATLLVYAAVAGCSKPTPRPSAPAPGSGGGPAHRVEAGVEAESETEIVAEPAPTLLSWPSPEEERVFATPAWRQVIDRFVDGSRQPLGREGDGALIERTVDAHVGPPGVEVNHLVWLSADEVMAIVLWDGDMYWFVVRREADGWAVHTKYHKGAPVG